MAANTKKPLPGKHGDSIDMGATISFMIYFGIGIVLGIVLFGFIL